MGIKGVRSSYSKQTGIIIVSYIFKIKTNMRSRRSNVRRKKSEKKLKNKQTTTTHYQNEKVEQNKERRNIIEGFGLV